MRKPIQIATMPETINFDQAIYVLCDDGTIWEREFVAGRGLGEDIWVEIEPIPQDKVKSK
jgi:hypothetical protein